MARTSGFSLLELMVVLIIVLTISGAVFQTINMTTQVDMFQEAREFMDQMSRDLRQAGYPSPRNYDPAVLTQNPIINDRHAAAGLVKVDAGDLWFEGDVDGSGKVSVVQYHLDTSTSNNCPCLKRSQIDKKDGDPVTGQDPASYQVEVQGVQNTNIFSPYTNGAAVGLPVTTATATMAMGITAAAMTAVVTTGTSRDCGARRWIRRSIGLGGMSPGPISFLPFQHRFF